MNRKILLNLLQLIIVFRAVAQPSADYIKMMNSYVPGSPEATQIMKYIDYPVNLYTGTPNVSYPLHTISGKDISLPIILSYHAGGGVKIDEQASNAGLGWLLNAGGEITREVRGIPDETSTIGHFNRALPMSYYINLIRNGFDAGDQFNTWIYSTHGLLDLEPDVFYLTVGPYSGKFMYDDSTNNFVFITRNANLKVEYNHTLNNWTITGDEGTKYILANKETTSTLIHDLVSFPTNSWSSPQTTSWKLSKIVNADATDSIILNYDYNLYDYYTSGSNIKYLEIAGAARPVVNSFSQNRIMGNSKLKSIVSSREIIQFIDSDSARLDIGSNQKHYSKIIVYNKDSLALSVIKLYHSYFNRPTIIGNIPVEAINHCKKSLRLDSFSIYGETETSLHPLTYRFKYNLQQLPARMSFAKDLWGYANNNSFTNFLAPKMYHAHGTMGYIVLDGADRTIDTVKVKAGILEEVILPTGGLVKFNYEPNTTSSYIPEATSESIIYQYVSLFRFKDSMSTFGVNYIDTTFTINEPLNYAVNGFLGGALAQINISPIQPKPPGNPFPSIETTVPYFVLSKVQGIPGTIDSSVSYEAQLQYENLYNQHLPNGVYRMRAFVYSFDQLPILNSIRHFSFTVSFKIADTTASSMNYKSCGVRIKSIETIDPYTNIKNKRLFKYHDPNTDSSFGKFMGPTTFHYKELVGATPVNAPIYLVRLGNNNMPGQGATNSTINYPKVIEEIHDAGIIRRIVHKYAYYHFLYPFYIRDWPFAPPIDKEHYRGNEDQTEYYEHSNGGFNLRKKIERIFDVEPVSLVSPYNSFSRKIHAIKSTSDSYTNGFLALGSGTIQVPAQHIHEYYTYVDNRVYQTSDTTTLYEEDGNPITTWNDYVYGDNNQKPIVTRTGNSDGTISTTKTWYPIDGPTPQPSGFAATFAGQLTLSNRVSQPLAVQTFKGSQLLNSLFTYGHMDGSKLFIDSLRQSLFSNPLEGEVWVTEYNNMANPLTVKMRGDRFRKYIWYPSPNLPLATCITPQNSAFVFTSFELTNEYAWNGTGIYNSHAFSGNKSYSLSAGGNLSFSGFSTSAGLEIYAWVYNGSGSFSANGNASTATSRTSGPWTLHKVDLGNVSSVTISGSAIIDNLAILPAGAELEANVYDYALRIISKVNSNMQTINYEYDDFGRLSRAIDEKGTIIQQNSYQYQGGNN